MRLIDADAIPWTDLNSDMPNSKIKVLITFADKVNKMPTIEERKKGKWRRRLVDCGFNADWHCSMCGWKTSLEEHGYNFCPNCGADMRGEEDDS